MTRVDRQIPNPGSQILPHALIGGAGLELPPSASVPTQGLGAVLLYTTGSPHLFSNAAAIQDDLGLHWIDGVHSDASFVAGAGSTATAFGVNPDSEILRNAIIGGMGMELPPWPSNPPPGMWLVLLYIPLGYLLSNSMNAIQNDLGLPWYCEEGDPVWVDDEIEIAAAAGP